MRHDSLKGDHDLTPKPLLINFARDYLNWLGNSKPTGKQNEVLQALLTHSRQRQARGFDFCLTELEKRCLYLAAEGKRLKETAACLGLSRRKLSQCRQSILQKMGCNNITSAVILGIRYGEISIPEN